MAISSFPPGLGIEVERQFWRVIASAHARKRLYLVVAALSAALVGWSIRHFRRERWLI
jgi:hypothetical protein